MHIKCSDTQFQHTHDASNIDISTSLTYLGALFQHAPYRQIIGNDSFSEFLSTLLHQYDDNTQHDTTQLDPNIAQPYQYTTLEPCTHRSITSTLTDWDRLRPTMTPDSPALLTCTLILIYTLHPANFSRATTNEIDHIYIGILLSSTHTTIRHHFSKFVTQ